MKVPISTSAEVLEFAVASLAHFIGELVAHPNRSMAFESLVGVFYPGTGPCGFWEKLPAAHDEWSEAIRDLGQEHNAYAVALVTLTDSKALSVYVDHEDDHRARVVVLPLGGDVTKRYEFQVPRVAKLLTKPCDRLPV